jgi:hypothetical protein
LAEAASSFLSPSLESLLRRWLLEFEVLVLLLLVELVEVE